MISLRKHSIKLLTLTTLLVSLCSCSHGPVPQRDVASQNCWDNVKPEYHSYFDSVEKCIEKKDKK